jgi:hypothetical protein
MDKNNQHEALNSFLETNKQPTKKYGFKALLNKQGSPRAESAGPSPSQSIVSKIKLIVAAHAAGSSVALTPLKHVYNLQEDEILNLIQKNLLYEEHKKKKIARGDFAKKYVSVDRPADQAAAERFHSS